MRLDDGLALGLGRKLPVIVQTEAAECGLACLAMVAGFHGHRIDLASLRQRFSISLKGTTLAALIDIAERMGLASRAVRLELEQMEHLERPCILHWRMSHFVVLESVGRRWLRIHDPAAGARRVTLEEASDAFSGVALELWPAADFTRRNERRRVRLRDLLGRVSGLVPALGQILSLALALEVFTVLSPLFLQWVIDHALLAADRDLLTTLALGFGLLVVLQQATAALRRWTIMRFGATVNLQWHANVLAHLLRLPLPYFEKRHLGDIVSRFRSIDAIQSTLTSSFLEACVDGLMAAVILIVIVLYSPLLSAVCLVALAVYLLGRWSSYRRLKEGTREQIVHAARQESHFLETARGARAIRLFGRESVRRASWLSLRIDQVNAGLAVEKLDIGYRLLNGLLFGIEHVLVVWLGARLTLEGQFSVGMLMAFLAYKGQFTTRVSALVDKAYEVKMLEVHGERLADIVLTAPEPRAEAPAGRLEASVELRGVRFRYAEPEPYVLDGVDLEIEPGKCVAIVGPSGGGKSTLLHIVLGILEPTAGDVLIGGQSVTHSKPERWRRTIGSVTQNDVLFAGTIAENISFFDPRPDRARIEQCAAIASIHREILAMPMGYNTFVGYLGSVLSGGQQQRVLLARALYARPRILVLDEATSHLDLRREQRVAAALAELDITRIVVAHRPQTASMADRIVTLSSGRVTSDKRVSDRGRSSVSRGPEGGSSLSRDRRVDAEQQPLRERLSEARWAREL